MRPKDHVLAKKFDAGIATFEKSVRNLPGIAANNYRETFIEQLVESVHRVKYVAVIRSRNISNHRTDPSSNLFDPLKAAILCHRTGMIDEAFWLVFLFVHFGMHRRTGWRLVRDVYGALNCGTPWDWAHVSADPKKFRKWLNANQADLSGHFGNHRKYESLNANSSKGTGAVVESYVNWVNPPQAHEDLIRDAEKEVGKDPIKIFDYLYYSMDSVTRFGRTAKFDYLTMVGKLGLAPITPGSPYIQGSTGPRIGALLLFGGSKKASLQLSEMDDWLVQLGTILKEDFIIQVLEDALCNWQKSPGKFKPFRG